jgi:hypothetical protein
MENDKEKALQELSDFSQLMEDEKLRFESKVDSWWNNLSEQEREWAFYSVVKLIYQGEIVEKGSYRYVLYDIFKFDPAMYIRGMDCGFMHLHNVIGDGVDYNAMRNVTRLEVIDGTGRICVRYLKDDEKVRYNLQDDDRTLKVFIDKVTKWNADE